MEDLLCLIKCIHNSFQSNPCLSGCYTLSGLLTANLSVPSLKSLHHYSQMMFKRKSVLIIPCLELFSASHYTFGSYFKLHIWPVMTSLVTILHLTSSCTISQAYIFLLRKLSMLSHQFLLCSPWQSGWSAVSLSLLTWFLIFIQVCDTLSSLQSLLYPFYFVPSTLFPPDVLHCHFVFVYFSFMVPTTIRNFKTLYTCHLCSH